MRFKQKLKSKSGFTLAETLLAVLILLLVSVIVANGIPVARNVYNNVIVASNAQVLLSTTVTALRNELGTAQDVSVTGTDILYYKANISAYSQISCPTTGTDGIQLLDYVNKDTGAPIPDGGSKARTPRALVSNAASNKNLYVTYATVGFDPYNLDVIVFKGLEVKPITGGKAIASLNELNIRLTPVSP